MAKTKTANSKKPVPNKQPVRLEPISSEEKIARMLGILAIQNVKARSDQAVMLRAGGFTNSEIAEMLDISDNGVSVLLYQAKQKKEKS